MPVENSKGEWGPGQEEINVRYAEALDMADRHAILKNGVKEIALSRPARRHLHGEMALRPRRLVEPHPASLWDLAGRAPLFADPAGAARHVAD